MGLCENIIKNSQAREIKLREEANVRRLITFFLLLSSPLLVVVVVAFLPLSVTPSSCVGYKLSKYEHETFDNRRNVNNRGNMRGIPRKKTCFAIRLMLDHVHQSQHCVDRLICRLNRAPHIPYTLKRDIH